MLRSAPHSEPFRAECSHALASFALYGPTTCFVMPFTLQGRTNAMAHNKKKLILMSGGAGLRASTPQVLQLRIDVKAKILGKITFRTFSRYTKSKLSRTKVAMFGQ
jgi:hypothetical protein